MQSQARPLLTRAARRAAREARDRVIGPPAVRLLSASPLFDHDWYGRCLGRTLSRREAVRDYLRRGEEDRPTPNPLFDPDFFAAKSRDLVVEGEDPLVTYVRGAHWEAPVHPLVDVAGYLAQCPEAGRHPQGPIGHYRSVGAGQGHRLNDWYQPDPEREPRGLEGWIEEQVRVWQASQAAAPELWGDARPVVRADGPPTASHAGSDSGAVRCSVVIVVGDAAATRETVETVLAQTHRNLEVVLCRTVDSPRLKSLRLPSDDRIIRLKEPLADAWTARNHGLQAASGSWVAFPEVGDRWLPGRLAWLLATAEASGSPWRHDVVQDLDPEGGAGPAQLAGALTYDGLARGDVAPWNAVLVSRAAAQERPFDPTRHHAAGLELLLGLAREAAPEFVDVLGVEYSGRARAGRGRLRPAERPFLDHRAVVGHADAVLNEALIDWASLADRPGDDDLVSVVIPTYRDHEMTCGAVRTVVEASREDGQRCEVIVVDNGCPQSASVVLASLPVRHPGVVSVVREPVNRGFALGNNRGLLHARGSTVVFLNNDTEVRPGWLAPLRESLADPTVLAAQSLLLYDGGAVQSAGVVFAPGGGVPHVLLQHFPREDAARVADVPLHALTGAALAARWSDVVALRGFDPVFRNGMEDVDFCLRLRERRAGHCVVRPESPVIHYESRTPGRFTHARINRKVFLERWRGRLPVDDAHAWGACGYRVVSREIRQKASPDKRLCVVEPVVERVPRAQVTESAPRLRWAIKNPAPFGTVGESWGDTHYARLLAQALGRLDQEVVIDHRPEFNRASAHHDEVVLLLRGLAPYSPMPGQVNLMWVISHPEMLARHEGIGWDHVYVASLSYAEELGGIWPVPVSPLLQATDPARFHPGAAEPDSGPELLFVGNSRRQRRPMVIGSVEQGLDLTVIGADWEGLIPQELVRTTYLPNSELSAAYRSAGIVLNDHWDDMRESGFISNRLFDAVASGARVISDEVAGLRSVFGSAVQVARTPEELAALVRAPDREAVFGTAQERLEQAARVAQEHSFDARARVLLDDAVRLWRERNR